MQIDAVDPPSLILCTICAWWLNPTRFVWCVLWTYPIHHPSPITIAQLTCSQSSRSAVLSAREIEPSPNNIVDKDITSPSFTASSQSSVFGPSSTAVSLPQSLPIGIAFPALFQPSSKVSICLMSTSWQNPHSHISMRHTNSEAPEFPLITVA